MKNQNILGTSTSVNILNLELKMSLKVSWNKTNQWANTKSLFFFLSKMHLCRCAIQVLGGAFSSIVSITPMAACPKLIPIIVDSEYNCSIRGRCKFSSSIK